MNRIVVAGPKTKAIVGARPEVTAGSVKMVPVRTTERESNRLSAVSDRLRVAGYCRISTEEESQQGSFLSQERFLRNMIEKHPGWELAGIYKDENCSGTSRTRRTEFNHMMADAKAGKIDYIITKSISRFARNTVDTLNCIQELRNLEPSVGVLFIREGTFTLDPKYDMIVTIMAALAQNESYSIAENIRWGLRKRFRSGIPQINLERMMGYDMGSHGDWRVNPRQAQVVRYIYDRYLQGCSAHKISVELNHSGVKTVNGKNWCTTGVLCILENEKYVGDLLIQKTYTKDVLNHRPVENNGALPRYYIPNHHEAIISRKDWFAVQKMIVQRARKRKEYNMVQRFLLEEAGLPAQ